MGTVYRVWDLKRNVPLAMKVLHADLAEDRDILERFQREARALRSLEHPNIIPFYGFYQTSSHNLLLQLYIDGPTLRDVLSQHTGHTLSTLDILCIMKSLCSALSFAHSKNVVHCDIKPANVLIDSSGKVYLSDFGIARHAESELTVLPGAGSPAYMAPEQITSNVVTKETDIYALGVLLYEMLTGQRPFSGTESEYPRSGMNINERIRYAHVYFPPPDPRLHNPAISPSISAIVLRALEKDPTVRFASCQEFFFALCDAFNTIPDNVPDRISNLSTPILQNSVTKGDNPDPILIPGAISKRNYIIYIGGFSVIVILVALLLIIWKKISPSVTPQPFSGTAVSALVQFTPEINSTPIEFQQTTELPKATNEPTLTQTFLSTETLLVQTATQMLPTRTPETSPLETPAFETYYPFPDCPKSQLHVGDSAYVTYNGEKIGLRSAPVGRLGDTLIRKLDEGEVVHVIDGPVCDLNLVLWKVRTVQNEFGWLPEGDPSEFWILPIPTKNVCPGAKPTRLWVGATAFVEPMPKDRNILYSEPVVDSGKELGRMNPESFMQVIEGPSCGSGSEGVWWYVYSEQLKMEGWTRESNYSADYYFIAPVIPRP